MFVKVCGIKTFEHIDWALELGYNAIGIIFQRESKRYVDYNQAVELVKYADKRIITVAVGLKYIDVKPVINYFDYIQLYEKPPVTDHLIFASHLEPFFNDYEFFLYDASRGSGQFYEFPEWLSKYRNNLIIAGGLDPKNIKDIVRSVQPYGVDVSSGVELGQVKNYQLMKDFIAAVRTA